jgi:glycosyltransferase involved in cell wall biosynthesis
LPKVIQRVPDAHLIVVGSKAPEDVLALDGGAITVKGYVSDEELDALYARAGAAVAPLRYGAGVKGKVIEAMARGVPLVTTPTGAQGIAGAPDALFLAVDADDFADCVVRALTDRHEARVRAEQAVRCVQADFSRRVMQKQLCDALQMERAFSA